MRCMLAGVSLVAAVGVHAEWLELHAFVQDVKDGNNLQVLCAKGFVHQIRLSGSDAPELGQPGGIAARDWLRELLLNERVRIVHRYVDERGRTLGRVFVGDVLVNERLVREGLAWFSDPDGDCPQFRAAGQEAKAERRGLWQHSSPVPPWQWRRGVRRRREGDEVGSAPPRFPRSPSSNEPKAIGYP